MKRKGTASMKRLLILLVSAAPIGLSDANELNLQSTFELKIEQCKDQLKKQMKENDRIFAFLSLFGDETPIGCYGVADSITSESRKKLHDKYIGDTVTDAEYRQNLIALDQEVTAVATSLGIRSQINAGSDVRKVTASEFTQIKGGSTNRAPIDTLKNYSTISGSK
jgi:hypothetical protein